MKKILFIFAAALLISLPLISFAQEATTNIRADVRAPFLEQRAEVKTQMKAERASSTPERPSMTGLRQELKGRAADGIEGAKQRAQDEIARRETILNAYIARLDGAKKLSDEDKLSLTANLEARLAELATLKADIANSTGTTTLRADIKSLTDLHKEFKAELPKAALTGAAERILSVVAQMEQFSVKLSARIDAATTAGTDVTALRTELESFNASVAQAKVNGQTALDAAKTVDTTTAATVKATIVAGQKNLQVARESARKIAQGLGVSVSASAGIAQ